MAPQTVSKHLLENPRLNYALFCCCRHCRCKDQLLFLFCLGLFPKCFPWFVLLTGSAPLWYPQDGARRGGGAPLCGEGGKRASTAAWDGSAQYTEHPWDTSAAQVGRAASRRIAARTDKWAKRLSAVEVQDKRELCWRGFGSGWERAGRAIKSWQTFLHSTPLWLVFIK